MRAEAESAIHLRTKAERGLMEVVVERGNLMLAYQRVVENKGAAGVDGISVAEFKAHLKQHWPTIKAKLLTETYIPQAVRRVEIPKPQGGVRTLGIPTLTDRLIQQALHQVLSAIFEAGFSPSSYGFRPGKSAHQAVKAARQYVAEGRRGPWWNSGASHMNHAFPKSYFDRLGLVSVLDTTRRLQCPS